MEETEGSARGGGEPALIRARDASATSLGPVEAWPRSPRTADGEREVQSAVDTGPTFTLTRPRVDAPTVADLHVEAVA